MDECAMIDLQALPMTMTLPVSFLAGFLLGYIYFHSLRETANLIVNQRHPLLGLALTLGRLALLGMGFYAAVLVGALALLAALAGVICAKALMLRQTQSIKI